MLIQFFLSVALLALIYGLFRWRQGKIEQQKRLLRQQRHQQQLAAWETMLAERGAAGRARDG